MKALLKNKYLWMSVFLLIGIVIGKLIGISANQQIESSGDISRSDHQHINTSIWTCSMHPSVRQNEPGKCPICGMDLIPLERLDDTDNPMEVKMSATAVKLANIQTTVITTGNAAKEVRLNGKVQADERKIASQAAHIPGRIEQLLVNFTGESIQHGKILAYVYSPELVTAQQELFEAYKIKDTQPALYNAAREKLKNWKLNEKQIDDIIASGKAAERFPIVSDVSGYVLKRNVNVGDYVERGMSIYDVVDLSSVWIQFDVYEIDMSWIKQGSAVDFTVQSLPGEKFSGKVSFIDPVIDPQTRVASARVEILNSGMKLKPEMFVTGIVKTKLSGSADIILPKSAVMWTGERSIVYEKKESTDGISFMMREVVLGPSLGDSYVIKSGLEPGMEIVTNGTFTIDAAAQLSGKPSMMNPEGGEKMSGHQHGGEMQPSSSENEMSSISDKFKDQLKDLLNAYLKVKDALVATDAKTAAQESTAFNQSLKMVDMSLLNHEAHEMWMPLYNEMKNAAESASKSDDIETQRKSFLTISDSYFTAINEFHLSGLHAYYQYCPMAFNNKGGHWISKEKEISNPYFGSKMMRCGDTVKELN